MNEVVSRIGITPVGSEKYRLNRLGFHLLAYSLTRNAELNGGRGKFIIRVDDTDLTRVNRKFLEPYLIVLSELGVIWDIGPDTGDEEGNSVFQSERESLYTTQLKKLEELGVIIINQDGSVSFDTENFVNIFTNQIEGNKISADIGLGEKVKLDIRSHNREGDALELRPFPLRRADGSFLFNFTSPVDDGLMGITHAVRDRDKIDLLAKQEMVRLSLGFPQVKYIHAPIIVNTEGKRLIHHDEYGEATYQGFLEKGILSKAIVSYLLSGYYGPSEQYYSSLDEFARGLKVHKIHRPNIVFNPAMLQKHNRTAIAKSTSEEYEASLKKYLELNNPALLSTLEGDQDLTDIISKLRRSFVDAEQFIIDLTLQQRNEPDPELLPIIDTIASLRTTPTSNYEGSSFAQFFVDNGRRTAEELGIDYSDYSRGVIKALLGRGSNLPVRDVVDYLDRRSELDSRLSASRNAIIEGQIDRGRRL